MVYRGPKPSLFPPHGQDWVPSLISEGAWPEHLCTQVTAFSQVYFLGRREFGSVTKYRFANELFHTMEEKCSGALGMPGRGSASDQPGGWHSAKMSPEALPTGSAFRPPPHRAVLLSAFPELNLGRRLIIWRWGLSATSGRCKKLQRVSKASGNPRCDDRKDSGHSGGLRPAACVKERLPWAGAGPRGGNPSKVALSLGPSWVSLRFQSGGHYRGLGKASFHPTGNVGSWGAPLQGADENEM